MVLENFRSTFHYFTPLKNKYKRKKENFTKLIFFLKICDERSSFPRFAVQNMLAGFFDFFNFKIIFKKFYNFFLGRNMFNIPDSRMNVGILFSSRILANHTPGIYVFIQKKSFVHKPSSRLMYKTFLL